MTDMLRQHWGLVLAGCMTAFGLGWLVMGFSPIYPVLLIGMALVAIWLAGRPASIERTFGFHRTEVLAALMNALALWLITALIFVEAFRRLNNGVEAQAATAFTARPATPAASIIPPWASTPC